MPLVRIWGDKLESGLPRKKDKPVARIGLGGTLVTTTEKGHRMGRVLGWSSFWAMVLVVALLGIRGALMALGVDFSNGILALQMTLWMVGGLAVCASHVLVFVCDALTGGDAKPSVWALGIFWGGLFLLGPFACG